MDDELDDRPEADPDDRAGPHPDPLVPEDPAITAEVTTTPGEGADPDAEDEILAAIESLERGTQDAGTEEPTRVLDVEAEIEEIGPAEPVPVPSADPEPPDDRAEDEEPPDTTDPEERALPAGPPGAAAAARLRDRFVGLVAALRDPSWKHSRSETFRYSLVVATAVGFAYWLTTWPLPSLLESHPDIDLYIVRPIVWLVVAALALHGWYRLEERPPVSLMLIGVSFVVGVLHVAVLLVAGVIWGFEDSAVAERFLDYPKNVILVTSLLLGVESARAYLFHAWRPAGERWAFGLVTAIFFVAVIPTGLWDVWTDYERISTFVAGRWAPALALSVLATFLTAYGGIGPSFAYRFALLGLAWFSPIIPDLAWPVLLILGVLIPVAAASLVRTIYQDTNEGGERAAEEVKKGTNGWYISRNGEQNVKRRWVGWTVTGALVAVIALFFNGAFGFYMVVIEGVSMEPAYERGDLAIVRENVDVYLLEVDDVIVFEREGRPLAHRIVAIEDTPAGLMFTTQGDNETSPNPPVREDRIDGKVVFSIPGVGHVNLWLRGG